MPRKNYKRKSESLENNSGIYAIINKVNDKKYYGSSKNIYERKMDHFRKLRANIHSNQHLQRAFNFYREENIDFVTIEVLPPIKSLLLETEQKYIDNNIGGYNKSPYAHCPGSRWSEEAKKQQSFKSKELWANPEYREKTTKRIKETRTLEVKAKISLSNSKRIYSEETKKKISESLKLYFLKNPEARKAISDRRKSNF